MHLIANSVLDFENATLVSLSRKPLSSSFYFFDIVFYVTLVENGENLISAQPRISAHSSRSKGPPRAVNRINTVFPAPATRTIFEEGKVCFEMEIYS